MDYMDQSVLGKLSYQFPFRKYQKLILQSIEANAVKDHRYHIVAPPGAGKTIVGIELIHRFGKPAVIFAPTSTIQLQWKEKVAGFIPEGADFTLDDIVSIDPKNLRPINSFTYQLVSTPSENLSFVEEAAIQEWKSQLLLDSIVGIDQEAENRVQTLKANNPATYKREVAKYYKKLKTKFLKDPNFDNTSFLHENARKLIDDLVQYGVKVIVLDESHHLLDYWAMVIHELIRRVPDIQIIGLTATPPISANPEEFENYLSIMGDIDFEIPTPAVVKEGNLAPYQDLVYFCTPTRKEKVFIDTVQDRFKNLIATMGQEEDFRNWVIRRIVERVTSAGEQAEWKSYFDNHPFLAIAGVKYLKQDTNTQIPDDIVVIEEMDQEMELDDWIFLLNDYCLNFLKLSDQKKHQDELTDIIGVVRSFGFVLTEKGMRSQRSPIDKVLAYTESKNEAVITILRKEMETMKDGIRAVVITDFEKQSATIEKALTGILDQESGGAIRAFRYIVEDEKTTVLEPILLTGTRVFYDVDDSAVILRAMETWRDEHRLNFALESKNTDYPKVVELVGSGPDWRSNTYVRMATALFEQGIVKCIVGTRGLLGEGWDSLSLNTLIDLTSATTSMTVNQLRGRSIRLDPQRPFKVANNWDVVCIDPGYEKGDQDLQRFIKKQSTFYGLGSNGQIIRGFYHVDPLLALEVSTKSFKRVQYGIINRHMLKKSGQRPAIYNAWEIGKEYSNFEFTATKLDPQDLKFKTVYTLRDSLKAIFNSIVSAIAFTTIGYFIIFKQFFVFVSNSTAAAILFAIYVAAVAFFSGKQIYKYFRRAFIDLPIDSFLLDIGKALLKSLREAKLVEQSQSVDNVRAVKDEVGYYDLYLDYATTNDAALFSNCLKELLAPVIDQRYLVSRSEKDIKLGFYTPFWWMLREFFSFMNQEKDAYHPVPNVLSVNKERAEIFAKNWSEYVGGGQLIYTRQGQGAQLLLEIRKYNRHKFKRMNFELWK